MWDHLRALFLSVSNTKVILYLFCFFLRTWMVPPHKWQPDGLNLARRVAIGVATLGFAWLVSLFAGNRTHAVRTWM